MIFSLYIFSSFVRNEKKKKNGFSSYDLQCSLSFGSGKCPVFLYTHTRRLLYFNYYRPCTTVRFGDSRDEMRIISTIIDDVVCTEFSSEFLIHKYLNRILFESFFNFYEQNLNFQKLHYSKWPSQFSKPSVYTSYYNILSVCSVLMTFLSKKRCKNSLRSMWKKLQTTM